MGICFRVFDWTYSQAGNSELEERILFDGIFRSGLVFFFKLGKRLLYLIKIKNHAMRSLSTEICWLVMCQNNYWNSGLDYCRTLKYTLLQLLSPNCIQTYLAIYGTYVAMHGSASLTSQVAFMVVAVFNVFYVQVLKLPLAVNGALGVSFLSLSIISGDHFWTLCFFPFRLLFLSNDYTDFFKLKNFNLTSYLIKEMVSPITGPCYFCSSLKSYKILQVT